MKRQCLQPGNHARFDKIMRLRHALDWVPSVARVLLLASGFSGQAQGGRSQVARLGKVLRWPLGLGTHVAVHSVNVQNFHGVKIHNGRNENVHLQPTLSN